MAPRFRLLQGARYAGLVLVMGCISLACSSTSDQLRARYARERQCDEDQVRVDERGGIVFRASGCGDPIEYVCPSATTSNAASCEERGAPRRRPSTGDPPPFPEPTHPDAPSGVPR